jgi:hypothetical protein
MVIPLTSFATLQMRFPEPTLRDGPVWAPSFVASRLKWPAILRVLLRGSHPNPLRRKREFSLNTPYIIESD